jgi:hypothetical protein
MNLSRRELVRAVPLGAAALVIAIPVALVAATREPLEEMPRRGGRGNQDDAENDAGGSEKSRANEQDGKTGNQQRTKQGDQGGKKQSDKQEKKQAGKTRADKNRTDNAASGEKGKARKDPTSAP